MKLHSFDDHNVVVKVSRRNVLTLLGKLHDPASAKTLHQSGPLRSLTLIAEDDESHYGERPYPAGPVKIDLAAVLQVATDLVEQVADEVGVTDDFLQGTFNNTARQIAYLRDQLDQRGLKVSIG